MLKKSMKKFLPILLLFTLIVGLFPKAVVAAEQTENWTFVYKFTLDDKTASNLPSEISIPVVDSSNGTTETVLLNAGNLWTGSLSKTRSVTYDDANMDNLSNALSAIATNYKPSGTSVKIGSDTFNIISLTSGTDNIDTNNKVAELNWTVSYDADAAARVESLTTFNCEITFDDEGNEANRSNVELYLYDETDTTKTPFAGTTHTVNVNQTQDSYTHSWDVSNISNYHAITFAVGYNDIADYDIKTSVSGNTASINYKYAPAPAKTLECNLIFDDEGNESNRGRSIEFYLVDNDNSETEITGTRKSVSLNTTEDRFSVSWDLSAISATNIGIKYTDLSPNGYTVTPSKTSNGYDYTFKYTGPPPAGKLSVILNVNFIGDDPSDRPASIPIALKVSDAIYNGTATTISGSGNIWTHTWSDLDDTNAYDLYFNNGSVVSGYSTPLSGSPVVDNTARTITYTIDLTKTAVTPPTPTIGDITAEVRFSDNNNFSTRPNEVHVEFGEIDDSKQFIGTTEKFVLSSSNSYKRVFENMDLTKKYKLALEDKQEYNGEIIPYVPYMSYDDTNHVVFLTLTYPEPPFKIIVDWSAIDPSIVPDSAYFMDGENKIEITKVASWTVETPKFYHPSNIPLLQTNSTDYYIEEISKKYETPKTTVVKVTKFTALPTDPFVFVNFVAEEDKIPASVKLTLTKEGGTPFSFTISKSSFGKLTRVQSTGINRKTDTYTVTCPASDLPANFNFTSEIDSTTKNANVTFTYIAPTPTRNITVKANFEGATAEQQPASVMVNLLDDKNSVVQSNISLNKADNYTYTLTVPDDGKVYKVAVEGTAVPANFTCSVSGLIATFTYVPPVIPPTKTDYTVSAVFTGDAELLNLIKPNSFNVDILDDFDNVVAANVALSAPSYTATVSLIPGSYRAVNKEFSTEFLFASFASAQSGTNITLTAEAQGTAKTNVVVDITKDASSEAFPENLTVKLMNGTTVVGTKKISVSDKNATYIREEFKGMQRYDASLNPIRYSVEIEVPEGYVALPKDDAETMIYSDGRQTVSRPYTFSKVVTGEFTLMAVPTNKMVDFFGAGTNKKLNALGWVSVIPAGSFKNASSAEIHIDFSGDKRVELDKDSVSVYQSTGDFASLKASDKIASPFKGQVTLLRAFNPTRGADFTLDLSKLDTTKNTFILFKATPETPANKEDTDYVAELKLKIDGVEKPVKNSKQTIKTTLLDSKVDYTPQTAPLANYEITLNDDAGQINEGNPIAIHIKAGDDIELNSGSVVVEIDGAPASPSDYTVDESNIANGRIVVEVPDGKRVVIKYDATVKKPYDAADTSLPDGSMVIGVPLPSEDLSSTAPVTVVKKPEEINFQVSVLWDDSDNADGLRPASFDIQLVRNGVNFLAPVSITGTSYTFEKLLKYDDGALIEFKLADISIPNYTTKITYANNVATITHTHKAEVITKKISVVWNDSNNADGLRPKQITAQLYDGIEKVAEPFAISEESVNLELSKNRNGKPADYNIQLVDKVPGYEAKVEKDGDNFKITLSHTVEKKDLKLKVEWKDSDNALKQRPEKVKVQLYEGKDKVGEEIELTKDNWNYTFKDMNVYKAGKKANYTVKFVNLPDSYTTEVTFKDFEITAVNTHKGERVEFSVSVQWEDEFTKNNKPANITVRLLADGKETDKVITLTEANNWTHTFKDLDKYSANQTVINYSFRVLDIAGYTVKITAGTNGQVLSVLRTKDNTTTSQTTPTQTTPTQTTDIGTRNASSNANSSRVQTGDDNNIILYIALGAGFLVIIAGSLIFLKKKGKK